MRILQVHWVEGLTKHAKKGAGSVSPQVVSPRGEVESLGVHVDMRGRAETLKNNNATKLRNTFNAAAVLLTRPALEKVGLFDEKFGSYLEDIDLGWRMTRAGFTHEVAPEVIITHLKHQTSARFPTKKAWLDLKNWWLVLIKNLTLWQWLRFFPSIMIERMRNLSGFLKTLPNSI